MIKIMEELFYTFKMNCGCLTMKVSYEAVMAVIVWFSVQARRKLLTKQ